MPKKQTHTDVQRKNIAQHIIIHIFIHSLHFDCVRWCKCNHTSHPHPLQDTSDIYPARNWRKIQSLLQSALLPRKEWPGNQIRWNQRMVQWQGKTVVMLATVIILESPWFLFFLDRQRNFQSEICLRNPLLNNLRHCHLSLLKGKLKQHSPGI